MTTQEHILLLHLFAQQNLFLKQLCDALKAEKSLRDEDIKLFGDFLHSDEVLVQVMVQRTLKTYLAEAQKLGVVTGLEVLQEGPAHPQDKA
jgi:hypothetical protein